jgi:gliding motility-associated-like protein
VQSPVAVAMEDIKYYVVAYNHGCMTRDSVNLMALDTPRTRISADTLICTGGTAVLSVDADGNYQYSWSPSTGLTDAGIANPAANPMVTQRYTVKVTGVNGCVVKDSVLVAVKKPDAFRVNPSPAYVCRGDSVRLTASASDGAVWYGFYWLSDIGVQDPRSGSVVVSPAGSGVYTVRGVDSLCQTESVVSVPVTVKELPTVGIEKSNDIDCIYGEAVLTVNATADGGVRQYTWWPAGGLTNANGVETKVRIDSNMQYYVQVTGANGCMQVDSVIVYATKGGGGINFPVANAFTPNGDGNNDCFGIKWWGYVGVFELSVFDRWGNRVYYSKDPYGCWDGQFNGQPAPAGTYVYMIKASALCGTAFRKGTVILIR